MPVVPQDRTERDRQIAELINTALFARYGDQILIRGLRYDINQNPQYIPVTGNNTQTDETDSELNIDLTPKELEAEINKSVVGQRRAVRVASVVLSTHYKRLKYDLEHPGEINKEDEIKKNIINIGPTGSGKTHLARVISRVLGVPITFADATKFSETGYVGGNVEDIIIDLIVRANGDLNKASQGIVYIDEIDKTACSNRNNGPDVSGEGVQKNLLRIVEDTEVQFDANRNPLAFQKFTEWQERIGEQVDPVINTKNIQFMVGGAFPGLDEIIKRRVDQKPTAGFHREEAQTDQTELLYKVTAADLEQFGILKEFTGRFPHIVVLDRLTEAALYQILKLENSPIIEGQKRDFMAQNEIQLYFDDDALRVFANQAYDVGTGARALANTVETAVLEFKAELPSTEIKEFRVTKEVAENPEGAYLQFIADSSLEEYKAAFSQDAGVSLTFSEDALAFITEQSTEQNKPLGDVCKELFVNYERLIPLSGQESLTITKEICENPQKYLRDIARNYADP